MQTRVKSSVPIERPDAHSVLWCRNPSTFHMKFPTLPFAATAFLACAVLAGCDRRGENLSEDAATAESLTEVTDRAIEEVAEAAMPMPGGGGGPCAGTAQPFGTCATLTDSGEDVYPRTVVVDFGTGCTGPNGITRSGVITLVVTGGMWSTEGATWTATFENFGVGNRTVNGTKTRTFTGANAEGQPTYSFTSDLSIVRNGASFAREASGTAVWLAGYDTEDCFDNIVQRDGTATVTGPQGGTRTRTFTAVVHDQVCGYPVSGTVHIERQGPDVHVEYGDGTCDNLATVERGGNSFLLNLDTHELTPQ